ncbi:MAG: hypothetical protein Q8L48_29635 [Archangium sp.]|nr:hypothetical protein [Archangium sp.]
MRLTLLVALSTLLAACGGPAPLPYFPVPFDAGESIPDGGHVEPGPVDAGTPDAGPAPVPGLVTLAGPLEISDGIVPPTNTRLAMLWFSSLDTSAPRRFDAVEDGRKLGEPVPARWRFDVSATPPESARGAWSTPGGGAGLASWGAVVAFRDMNNDGALTVLDDGTTPDELVGSSAGALPFDADGPGVRTLLLWRQGTLGADEDGMVQGFNLVRVTGPLDRPSLFPTSMDLPLPITNDPRLGLMFCPPAFSAPSPELACGQRVFRTPQVHAVALSAAEGFTVAYVQVHAGPRPVFDARVTLDGAVLPFTLDGTYSLIELSPRVLRAGHHQLRVEAPYHEALNLELVLPARPHVTAPAVSAQLQANQVQWVKWDAVPLANSYGVSLFLGDSPGVSVESLQNEAKLPLPAGTGPATLEVTALSLIAAPRHFLLGSATTSMPVTLVP